MPPEDVPAEVPVNETVTTPTPNAGMIPKNVWDEFERGQMGEAVVEPTPSEDDPPPGDKPAEEQPKPETETPEEKPAETPEATPAEEEPDAVAAVLADLNTTLEAVNKKLDATADKTPGSEQPPKEEVDPALKMLLEHDDERVRDGAKALIAKQAELDQRLSRVEQDQVSREIREEAVKVEAEMKDVATNFGLTDDKGKWTPFAKEHIEKIAEYLESDPVLASTLTFKEGALRVYPAATSRPKLAKTDAPNGATTVRVPSKPTEAGAAVTDRPAVAGSVPKTERAPDGENMEQAVDRGMRKLLSNV